MAVLVTGTAGFIGYHVAAKLLARGEKVYGLDVVNDYYDVNIKNARTVNLSKNERFSFHKIDLSHKAAMDAFFTEHIDITHVIHLAAQAGVRYSLENPHAYIQSNIVGHLNILEAVRHSQGRIKHLVYASSSSVYGENKKSPFNADDRTDAPISLYAATKKADEMMTHSYCSLYKFSAIGLRFFTVYGPWGRPDMAAFLFADAIRQDKPINVFNNGQMKRDFTYIDDIVAGIIAGMDRPPQHGEAASPDTRHKIYNLGNNRSENLMDMIALIEDQLGKKAVKNMLPMQLGDVPESFADIDKTKQDLGYDPKTPISVGIPNFIAWYKDYYQV